VLVNLITLKPSSLRTFERCSSYSFLSS
jgi:hypothetical protein